MAKRSDTDGIIVVDTEIDTEGFRADSGKLKKAISSMNGTFNKLGPTFQKALSGSSGAISSFDAKTSALESSILEIKANLDRLGRTKIPTEDYQWLTAEIKKTNSELDRLYDKQAKMEAVGVKQSSQAWRSLQYDIDLARRKLSMYKDDQNAMKANGTAYTTGKDTAEYAKYYNALKLAKDKLAEMKAQVQDTAASTAELAAKGDGVKKSFSRAGKSGKKAIGGLAGKLKGLTNMLKQMLVFRVFMSIFTAITDGFKNLSQYSTQTNADLSALKSGLTQLKNSFATAFAPILTVVTPALTKLINYLSMALTYIGKFVAALTGAKTFTKAIAVQEDYAASLGETGKAAKNAQKQLAGFDELNVLSDSSSDSGGGGAGSVAPSEMFEEVPIESSITDFVSRIKEAFKNGDYAAIGNIVAQGFNAAIDKLHSVFTDYDWPGLAAGFTQGLNGFVRGVNWSKLGTTLSVGMRTSIATMRSAITTFDWASLGKGVSDAINAIDWVGILSDLAGGISDILKGALDLLVGFAENLDWGKLGRDLWNGLIGILTNIDWSGIISKAFRLLGNAVGGATTLVVEFCKTLWASLKSGFENLKKTYFEPYMNDMGKLTIEGFFKGIGDMFKDIGNWIVENIWNPFITGFKNAFGIHSPSTKMAEMGGYIIQGLCNGIKNAWSSITGFFSNALNSIKTTLSNAWDSVKTTATTKWNTIKSSLSTTWEGIKTTASTKWNNLKSTISTAWDSVKTTATTKWTNIKTSLSTAWEGIKTTASTKWTNLKTSISTAWDNIKTTASSKWESIKTTLSGKWDNIKSTASTKWTNLKSTISTKWTEIKNNASSTWDTVKTNLASKWDSIKSTASTKWDNIKSTIKNKGWSGVGSDICNGISSGIDSGWSWLKTKVGNVASSLLDKAKSALGIHSPSRLFRDIVGLNIGYGIGEGIEASEGSVVKTVTGLADAIAAEANAGEYNIGGVVSTAEVDGALTGFSDKVANSFSTLLERLQAIADGVTFTVPAMATGTVQPYHTQAAMNGAGTINMFDASTERLGDELSSVIIQSVTNATVAVVNAIEQNCNTTVNLDAHSIATSTIKEINRRTRAMGKSPIYI